MLLLRPLALALTPLILCLGSVPCFDGNAPKAAERCSALPRLSSPDQGTCREAWNSATMESERGFRKHWREAGLGHRGPAWHVHFHAVVPPGEKQQNQF